MELGIFELSAVFLTALVATGLSVMSGAGTEIILYPVLISLGIPVPLIVSTALTTNIFWGLPTAYNFLKERAVDWWFVILFSAIGLVGSYVGILFLINVEQRIYQIIIGAIILFLVGYTYLNRDLGLKEQRTYSKARQAIAYPFALLHGFYEQILGAGNGIAVAVLTFYTKGFDFIDALGHYYLVLFPWSAFCAALLISKGYFDIKLVILATLGSLIGAYTGSRYARYKGNRFIKTLFVIVGGILGSKLLLGL